MKKLASTVSAALLVAVLAVGLAATGAADVDQEDDSEVEVTVSSEVAVDVQPDTLSYSDDLTPGESNFTDDVGHEQIEIENIGSEDIGEVWAASSSPSEDPFGQGETDAHNTGNFVQISLATALADEDGAYPDALDQSSTNENPHYINRVEFTEDPAPSYIQTDTDSDDLVDSSVIEDVDIGRFRMGEEEYFYAVYHDGDGTASCSGDDSSELWVGESVHTPGDLGTFDFTTNEDSVTEEISDTDAASDYGVVEGVELGDEEYNLFTYCDEDSNGHAIRTRFNVEIDTSGLEGSDDTIDERTDGQQRFILEETSTADNTLRPGQSFPVDVGVNVPNGVPEGSIEDGSLTIFANQFEE